VYEALKRGDSQAQIDATVVAMLDEMNFSNMFTADLRKEADIALNKAIKRAQSKYKWELNSKQKASARQSVDQLTRQTAARIMRGENALKEKISRTIAEGIISGRTSVDIVADVVSKGSQYTVLAQTWENTARAGYQTQSNIAVAREAGVEKFKLVGASPEREFCKKYFGETHELSFWKKLNNGQGLPVVPHCGGYNCTHTLEPDVE
jgi:vacuolar-type H+-ATPase subunit I/STV1